MIDADADTIYATDLKVRFYNDEEDMAELLGKLDVSIGDLRILVAKGFETDFASVPGWVILPGIVPKVGRIRVAAVVHDWIYRGREGDRFSRKEADYIMYLLAVNSGMSEWRAFLAYLGVRLFGWKVWNKYHNK